MIERDAVGWWRGTSLVARRSFLETVRSRTIKLVTVAMALIAAVAVVVPQMLEDRPTYTLATVGEVPEELRAPLEAYADADDFEVEYVASDDEAAVRAAVRDGEADVGLAGGRVLSSAEDDGQFPLVLGQVLLALDIEREMGAAGLSAEQVTRLRSVQPPEQVIVQSEQEQARSGIAYASGIVLYLALVFAGSAIATAVAVEKSSRISEVLLAVLRPTQVMVGTVLAVGAVALGQLLVLAVPIAIGAQVTDLGLPSAASGDIALAVMWFLLGFGLYAFVYAGLAALVDKVTEVNTAVMPVNTVLIAAYFLVIFFVTPDPRGGWSVATSIFPFTAPMAMPIRWASGDVPVWQLVVAAALTAASAVALAWLASTVYRTGLVVTGRRLGLRELPGLLRGDRGSRRGHPSTDR